MRKANTVRSSTAPQRARRNQALLYHLELVLLMVGENFLEPSYSLSRGSQLVLLATVVVIESDSIHSCLFWL